jgi:hypothetical protein
MWLEDFLTEFLRDLEKTIDGRELVRLLTSRTVLRIVAVLSVFNISMTG